MQLGDGALMTDSDQDIGVGVNLIWTKISGVQETLGHRQGGANSAIVGLSGAHRVTVTADLDTGLYTVEIDSVVIQTNLSFDQNVDFNTIRLFTDGLNHQNFSGRSFDEVLVEGSGG